MTNKTFTTPCGTTYHVGQVLHNYTEAGPLLDIFGLDLGFRWYTNACDAPSASLPLPSEFPITITDLPPQPAKEPETVEFEELTGKETVWVIHPLNRELDCFSPGYFTAYDVIANHAARGHKLYKTEADAQLAKDLGWK